MRSKYVLRKTGVQEVLDRPPSKLVILGNAWIIFLISCILVLASYIKIPRAIKTVCIVKNIEGTNRDYLVFIQNIEIKNFPLSNNLIVSINRFDNKLQLDGIAKRMLTTQNESVIMSAQYTVHSSSSIKLPKEGEIANLTFYTDSISLLAVLQNKIMVHN